MFDHYEKSEGKKCIAGVEFMTKERFQEMILDTLYEMVFLSYFNEPSFDDDAFSGHILDSDSTIFFYLIY